MNSTRSGDITPGTDAGPSLETRSPAAKRGAETGPDAAQLRAWLHEGLHDLPRDSHILAVGCDEAFLATQLAEYSTEVTVLDTSAGQIAQLARRFTEISFLRHNPSSPLPFEADTFDAIWSGEFLDRVFDPARALAEMHRVLAPDGRLLLTVPDHGGVRNALETLFNWDDHLAAAHPRIRHFTRRMLVKLVQQAGFGEVHTQTIAGMGTIPRRLLLEARKGSRALVTPVAARSRARDAGLGLMEDLAFATRSRAA